MDEILEMDIFKPITSHLENISDSKLSFSKIEKLLGFKLPSNAHSDISFWTGSLNRPWVHYGWVVDKVSLGDSVTFRRIKNKREFTNVNCIISRYSDLRVEGWSGFMYLPSGEFYQMKKIGYTDKKLILDFFDHKQVTFHIAQVVSNSAETIFKITLYIENYRFLFYKEVDESDRYLDYFDGYIEDDFEEYIDDNFEEYIDDNYADNNTEIICPHCKKALSYPGECYCAKNSLSVTVVIRNPLLITVFNEYSTKDIMTTSYLFESSSDNVIWNHINYDNYSYFRDIIIQENGFYRDNLWVEFPQGKASPPSPVYPSNLSHVMKEASTNHCDKCHAYTRVYWNDLKWLCKPCELALERKRAGYFD